MCVPGGRRSSRAAEPDGRGGPFRAEEGEARVSEMEEAVHRAETVLPVDLAVLGELRLFVREFCACLAQASPDLAGVARLELALNEAVTNVIKHAYHGRSKDRIHISAEANRGRLTFQVCHHGEGFDPESVPEPSFDGSRDGGFGLYIIRHCVDELSFFRDEEDRNCMRLVINLRCIQKGGSHGCPC